MSAECKQRGWQCHKKWARIDEETRLRELLTLVSLTLVRLFKTYILITNGITYVCIIYILLYDVRESWAEAQKHWFEWKNETKDEEKVHCQPKPSIVILCIITLRLHGKLDFYKDQIGLWHYGVVFVGGVSSQFTHDLSFTLETWFSLIPLALCRQPVRTYVYVWKSPRTLLTFSHLISKSLMSCSWTVGPLKALYFTNYESK
jgi:hypothetical protein